MMNFKRFFMIFFLYSLALFIASFIFSRFGADNLVSQALLFMVPFFFLVVIVSRFIIQKALKKHQRKFPVVFLSLTGFRLFFYITLLVAYSLFFSDDAAPFIVSFFIFYFLFTFPEVYLLYKGIHL